MTQLTIDGIASRPPKPLFGWPGAKRRQVATILPHLLDAARVSREIVSPFIGGGSVELAAEAAGYWVHAADANYDLAHLWGLLLDDPDRVADEMRRVRDLDFAGAKAALTLPDVPIPLDDAGSVAAARDADLAYDARALALFLRLTCCIYTRPTSPTLRRSADGADVWRNSLTRAKEAAVRRFAAPKLSVECRDFAETLRAHPDAVAYCDPPYIETGTYRYRTMYDSDDCFDHDRLARALADRRAPWILSINDCDRARDLWAGHRTIEVQVHWHVGMGDARRPKTGELLIFG